MRQRVYPFTAIIGQEEMKRALILNLIYPNIGGVFIRGEKGTAKSTAIRALSNILPVRRQIKDCIFSCLENDPDNRCDACRAKKDIEYIERKMRVVELPINATEDRVVGTIDVEYAIKHGEKRFEPGILAEANNNILYIDEVNLLDDHVVDVLLDAAAMGVNIIEREGISYAHPSRFILFGTMNPEEGDLRPQLIDRFGLVVDVRGEEEIEKRVAIMQQRIDFEKDPESFVKAYEDKEKELADRILRAQEMLPKVSYDESILRLIASITSYFELDGHRGDLAIIKTALANAAFCRRETISKEDILLAAKLALPHRMYRNPFDERSLDFDYLKKMVEDFQV